MKTWVALLRGINVGGSRILPMKELVALLEGAGFTSVRTYIQSGNIVFRASKGTAKTIGTRIAGLIEKRFGFDVPVMVLEDLQLADAIANNPFPKAITAPASLHLCFLAGVPDSPDLDSLGKLKTAREGFVLKGQVFYLHVPDGAGNSKLAARAERALGVDTTARNWRTVNQLMEMCDEISTPKAR